MRLLPHTASWRRSRSRVLATLAAALALTAGLLARTAHSAEAATLLSQGKTATASSVENASFPASAAVDGNTGTRWSSAFIDPQWLEVDLGATASVSQVVLEWEAAYATSFQIQVLRDGTNWTTVYSTTTCIGGTQTLPRHRHRPLRPDVRHGPRYPVRVLAVGVRGLRHRRCWPPRLDPQPTSTGSGAPPPRSGVTRARSPRPPSSWSTPREPVQRAVPGRPGGLELQRPGGPGRPAPYVDMPRDPRAGCRFNLGSPTSPYYGFIECTVDARRSTGTPRGPTCSA